MAMVEATFLPVGVEIYKQGKETGVIHVLLDYNRGHQ